MLSHLFAHRKNGTIYSTVKRGRGGGLKSINIAHQMDQIRGVLNTPDHLGLMIAIWANRGFDFATFSIFYPILSLIMDKIFPFGNFSQPKSWVDKMIQYAPGSKQCSS